MSSPRLFWALVVLVSASPALAASEAGDELRDVAFAVRPAVGSPSGFDGELSLIPAEDRWERRQVRVGEDGSARAPLPVGSTWRVCPELETWWGRCELVTVEAGPGVQATLPVEVWVAGRVSGSLELADAADRLPERVAAVIWARTEGGEQERIPESTIPCSRIEPAGFTCKLPAMRLDLILRTEGFVPREYLDVEVAAGADRSLGSIRLERGSSLIGQVEVDGGAIERGACVARLSPFVPPGPGRNEADRGARAVATAEVRTSGSFLIAGVPPGTYLLEVDQPGYAPTRAFPIELSRESETHMTQPVVLRRPLAIEIELSPPVDWLERPWTVKLTRQSDFSSGFDRVPAIVRRAGSDGRLRVPDQSPGTFALQVLDSEGNSMYGSLSVPVHGAEDLPLRIEIGLVAVTGEVVLGSDPLPARLWFGGRHGEVSVAMESDLEGRFAGVLPQDGWWRLAVAADEPKLELETRVEVRAEDGSAEVRVEFPDTELFGRVVHESGAPAAQARVSLDVEGTGAGQVTDDSGEFRFRGIPVGIATLGAHQRSDGERLTSEIALVPVAESTAAGPVELRLRRSRKISGRVVSQGEPIAGAVVKIRTLEPASAAYSDAARADGSGSFSLGVHPDATLLTAVVSPPGHSLTARVIPAREPILLDVPRHGGTLELVRGQLSSETEGEPPPSLAVLQDGTVLGWQELWSWSRGHSVVWVKESPSIQIPNMAPGHYRFCTASAREAARAGASNGDWQAGLQRCADGHLETGSTLRLDLSEP